MDSEAVCVLQGVAPYIVQPHAVVVRFPHHMGGREAFVLQCLEVPPSEHAMNPGCQRWEEDSCRNVGILLELRPIKHGLLALDESDHLVVRVDCSQQAAVAAVLALPQHPSHHVWTRTLLQRRQANLPAPESRLRLPGLRPGLPKWVGALGIAGV